MRPFQPLALVLKAAQRLSIFICSRNAGVFNACRGQGEGRKRKHAPPGKQLNEKCLKNLCKIPCACASCSLPQVSEQLICSPDAGLVFVGFYQLLAACARDFFVRPLTPRQCGPPALFNKFPLPPCTGFLELRQFHCGLGLRHELLNVDGGKGGDKRCTHPFLCQRLGGGAQCPPQPTKADDHHADRAGDGTPDPWFDPLRYLDILLLVFWRKIFSPSCDTS